MLIYRFILAAACFAIGVLGPLSAQSVEDVSAKFSPKSYEKGSIRRKKYNLSVCAIFDDETKSLKEWIEYHRLVGVDHFYLYFNGNGDGQKKILRPFIIAGIVKWIPWQQKLNLRAQSSGFDWALFTQIPAYENAIYTRAAYETTWLVFLSPDEFLVPPKKDTISEVLLNYQDHAGLLLSSDYFDASVIQDDLVITATDLVSLPLQNPQQEVVKMIFQPRFCKGFTWFPYQCLFINSFEPKTIPRSELRVNKYVYQRQFRIENVKRSLFVDHRTLPESELGELLHLGYKIEDPERAIHRFLPYLQKQMQ